MLAAKDSHETGATATQFVQVGGQPLGVLALWSFAHAAMEPMN